MISIMMYRSLELMEIRRNDKKTRNNQMGDPSLVHSQEHIVEIVLPQKLVETWIFRISLLR